MSTDKKRHHYVPKAYLKAFVDAKGRIYVYRKDEPDKVLHVNPDTTQFQKYYYSQPLPEGGTDNNRLEDFFSTIEDRWPDVVARMKCREPLNDNLEQIFNFVALQRARVPAARDMVEATMATTVKATIASMIRAGKVQAPPAPLKLEDIAVTIDPHQSIHAMSTLIAAMGPIFSRMGLAVVHNQTGSPFLTSDNPVLWFDPSVPFAQQRPYNTRPNGPINLLFPVTPYVLVLGSNRYLETFREHGLLHTDVESDEWVHLVNAQISRFAYEAVIAQAPGTEAVIREFASVSPHEPSILEIDTAEIVVHRQVFGARPKKLKWVP